MEEIRDINIYTSEMRRAAYDKMWFVDKVKDIKNIFDFRCADGSLLDFINNLNLGWALYGYDNNKEMIELAKKRNIGIFTSDRIMARGLINNTFLVNASSVIHEIMNYSHNPSDDLNFIFNSGARYIAIRDMFYDESMCRESDCGDLSKVLQKEDINKIRQFESFHGKITDNKNLIHYLLKYRYEKNWDRECQENYFPYSLRNFIKILPQNYNVIYLEHYTLPFFKQNIKENFNIDIKDATHAKILLERKKV